MFLSRILLILCIFVVSVLPLKGQYTGDQQLGLLGLKAGTMPAPGLYVTLPLYFRQGSITFNDAHGNQILNNLNVNVDLLVVPAVAVVTRFKIFGATYGAAYTQWITNGEVNVVGTNFQRSSGWGFGDIYVQPLILGWHLPFLDVTAGYAFFAPTGKGSAGHQMWVNEIDFGATFYFDSGQKWSAATMMNYDFNQTKNNADIKVGQILQLSGGVGRSFLKGAASAGVAYGAQWKMTQDSGSDIPAILPITDGRFFGVGPEVNIPVFAKGLNVGLVGFRYLWIVGPKTALGGQLLNVSFTFAHLLPPKK